MRSVSTSMLVSNSSLLISRSILAKSEADEPLCPAPLPWLVKDKSTRLNLGDPGGRKLSRNAAKYITVHFVQIIDSLTHTHTHIQPKGGNKRPSDWADDKDNKKTSFVVGCCFFFVLKEALKLLSTFIRFIS